MERSAERMVNLTDQLLVYAGSVNQDRQEVDLGNLIDETLDMLSGGIQAAITLRSELAPDLWPVEGNPSQLRQVLVNLITNACEAMESEGGTMLLRTENLRREGWICSRRRQHPAGEYVHLAVEDTGPGIDEQIRHRLFEPFFSTKFMGRGLGLAVASSITRDHQGCIEIESTAPRGATVHVYLPRA
jgi:signal transduction histidine kinase